MASWLPCIYAGLFIGVASGQTASDPAEILKKVSEAYAAASQYEIESSVVIQTPDRSAPQTYTTHLWFSAPDKYRLQSSGDFCARDQTGDCPQGVQELLTVYRSGKLWDYAPASNEYREYTAPNLQRDNRPEDVDLYMGAGMFRHASEIFTNKRLLREERMASEGRDVDCEVIEAGTGDGSASLWIDKSRHVVLRMESSQAGFDVRVTYKTVRLSGPLPDDLFDFKPPAGARKTEGAFGKTSPQ
jgi:outer membrane lipoprotein-sorting protein